MPDAMGILGSALRLLASFFGIGQDTLDYIFQASRLGGERSPLPYPVALASAGARLWARGWFNDNAFDTLQGWVLPYWATRQSDPSDRAFTSRALNPVTLNQNLRDWTMVGNLASEHEAIIDPRGLLTPWWDGWSLDAWVQVADAQPAGSVESGMIFPSRLADERVEQRLYENIPVVMTRYETGRLRIKQEAFAVQDADKHEWLVATYTVENPRSESRHATLYLSIRPFNPEGASLIRKIEYKLAKSDDNAARQASGVFFVNDALAVVLPEPVRVALSNHRGGDVAFQLRSDAANAPGNSAERVDCEVGLASAFARYELDLPPNTSHMIVALMPVARAERESDLVAVPAALKSDTVQQMREQTVATWKNKLAQGMRVSLPDDRMNDAFEASKAYLLLLHDGESITPGPFLYHRFWVRDAAFMLNALDKLGYSDEVAQVLKRFPRMIRKDGFFKSQDDEWDANGQALWALVEHARLSGDWESVREKYWDMLNLAHWIDAARHKTKRSGGKGSRPAHWGLLPAGFSAEHFGPADYYYWDNFWGAAGLRQMALAADFFGQAEDAKRLRSQYDAYRADIEASLVQVAGRLNSPLIPASPYRNADSAMIGSLAAFYPTHFFDADDSRLARTAGWLEQHSQFEDAFFHSIAHTALGSYLSLHLAQYRLARRDPRAWKVIEWVSRHATSVSTWAEGIHPVTRRGGMGDSPHGWAAAEWIHAIRNGMLFEEGNALVLTPALPREWTAETTVIRVENAYTCFGTVSFTLAFGSANTATLLLTCDWRTRPDYIEWNFPFPLKQAGTEEHGLPVIGNAVRVPNDARRVVAMW